MDMAVSTANVQTQDVASLLFKDLDKQTQAYEIVSAEDRRERYLFFGGDVGDVAYSGGMRVGSPSILRNTLYRCLVTPCVTVRKMELISLIPSGAMIPGSADRIKTGCGEYWLNAGPEAASLLNQYGNPGEPGRNLGLVELAPDFLCGQSWEQVVKPLDFTKTFFPDWPTLPKLDADLIAGFMERFEYVRTTSEPRIAGKRALYLAVGADMLRALEAGAQWHEWVCQKTNHAVAQPHGDETYKRSFDPLDKICFERSGAVQNTDALRRVAEAMKTGTNNGLSAGQLQDILKTVVPQQQPAFSQEDLAMAIGKGVAMAMKMMQEQPVVEETPDIESVPASAATETPNSPVKPRRRPFATDDNAS